MPATALIEELRDAVSIRELRQRIPAQCRPSTGSIQNWIREGCGQQRIRLRAIRVGHRIFVRLDDWDAFMEKCQEAN